ncbi:MAG: hypothetical protein C4291_09070 [Candidatus Dadabacteria bacterium]
MRAYGVFSQQLPWKGIFLKYQDRILFGSDFPNIPYEYSNQVTALRRLNLGKAVERKIFNDNALNLLGLKEP